MSKFDVPEKMAGVVLTGHGGLDKLEYREDLTVPIPGAGEVLIRVKASSVNNTDINTRIGWYSKSVTGMTNEGGSSGFATSDDQDAGWSGQPLQFPRIQGADCYGEIVAVGESVGQKRIGESVLVRTLMRSPVDFRPFECWTFGSETDGGFSQYAVAPSADTFRIESTLSDAELGSIPCAFSTAEGMLERATVREDDTVLILGASGGVGSAAVQLTRLRGARVIAVASEEKADAVRKLGADEVIPRNVPITEQIKPKSVSVIVDLVGGDGFRILPELLQRGGRYVTAGAIAGPIVTFDLRTLYLSDLSFFGSTVQEDAVFRNIVHHLAEDRLKPLVAASFPLAEIRKAQDLFLSKSFVGKIALIP